MVKTYDMLALAAVTVSALEAELYAYVMTTDHCTQTQAYIEEALKEARERADS